MIRRAVSRARSPHRPAGDPAEPYRRDLDSAREVQQRLVPRQLPALPGWEFAAFYRPARVVSGDYYDLCPAGPGHLAVALGDVSGQGLGPALVMAGLRALVRSRVGGRRARLGRFMQEVNGYLLATTPEDMFVTLFLAVVHVPSGQLTYVNGGHPPPMVLPPEPDEPARLDQGGPVLGALPGASYEQAQAHLPRGSLLALFSDGLTESVGPGGEPFGDRRVLAALRAAGGTPPALALNRLLAARDDFVASRPHRDDLSLVLIRRQAPDPEGRTLS
jgi:phosphoserine phosphatase RsbU/P